MVLASQADDEPRPGAVDEELVSMSAIPAELLLVVEVVGKEEEEREEV